MPTSLANPALSSLNEAGGAILEIILIVLGFLAFALAVGFAEFLRIRICRAMDKYLAGRPRWVRRRLQAYNHRGEPLI